MKELEEENLNEVEEIKENEEFVELTEEEEQDLTGGGSASGRNMGYSAFEVSVGRASTMSASLKVGGQEIEYNSYRIVGGWGVKWLWDQDYNGNTSIKILCNPGPNAFSALGVLFNAKPLSGKGTRVKSFAGGWLRYDGKVVTLEWFVY